MGLLTGNCSWSATGLHAFDGSRAALAADGGLAGVMERLAACPCCRWPIRWRHGLLTGDQHTPSVQQFIIMYRFVTRVIEHVHSIMTLLGCVWQGASIAAALCALQQQEAISGNESCSSSALKFAILCSGYISRAEEHRALHEAVGILRVPSLHVYGAEHDDRQITAGESKALQELFDPQCRYVIEHQGGHYIPANKPVISRLVAFLQRCVD